MEINFRNSSTKVYLEKSPLPKYDREFLIDCAEKVFSIFSVHSDYLRHNGERFYLRGKFENFLFNPSESISENIFKVSHLETFKNDIRFKITVFGQQCFIHPDDVSFIDAIFAPNLGLNVQSKSVELTLIELTCKIVNNLSSGRMIVTINFENSNATISNPLKRLLCIIAHGGVFINSEKVS